MNVSLKFKIYFPLAFLPYKMIHLAWLDASSLGNWGEAAEKRVGGERTSSQKREKQSVATAWQVSRIEAVLYHLAIRPGCIGTRGPCAPCRHTPFLSPQPCFITHVQPGTQKPRTTFSTLQPCVSSQPSSSYTRPGSLSLCAPCTAL